MFSSVTNQDGANTRLAIANTGSDPFGTSGTSGSCTLSFHGANAPFPIATENIAAGSVYTASTSLLAPGFQGYVVAECPFPHSRGWAFTSPAGAGSDGGSETAEILEIPRSAGPSSLLFSAVTNRNGADTGIVIANTSQDPFGTAQTPGACAISYFGDMAGNGSTPSPSASTQIRPGDRLSFSLSEGNPAQGIPAVPGFRGYVIADCTFPAARGIATTTVTAPRPSVGKKTLGAGPVITVSDATVGENRQAMITITLSPTPDSDVFLTIESSNPSLVKLGASGAAGTGQITTTIPAGTSSIGTYAQAFSSEGSATITARGGGYADGAGSVTLSRSGFVLMSPGGMGATLSTYAGVTTPLTIWAARLDGSNLFAETQQVRGGYTVSVPISSTMSSVGTVSPSSVPFEGGMDSAIVQFTASGSGATTVALGAPPALPATGYSVAVTVQQSGMKPFNATVGKNLQVAASIELTGSTPVDVTVTLQSNDETKLKFSSSPTGTPSPLISLMIPANHRFTPDFYVVGLDSSGSAGYTATAPGYGSIDGTVGLAPSGLLMHSPFGDSTDFTMPLGVGNATIEVWSVRLSPLLEFQAVAGGATISVAVTSGTTSVGTITTSPIAISGGAFYASTAFHPVANGWTTITATSTGYTSAPSIKATVQATAPLLTSFTNDQGQAIGRFLEEEGSLILPVAAPPGGVDVTLQSNSGSLALSASATTAGSSILTLHIAGGGTYAKYYVQALGSSGSVTYTANAPGYAQGTGAVDLAPSSILILGPATPIQLSGGPVALAVTTAYLDPVGAPVAPQSLAGGAPLVVTLQNTNSGTGTVPNTVTIAPGTYVIGAMFTPKAGGTTSISAAQPLGWTIPTSMRQLDITVQGTAASLSISKTHSGNFVQGQANAVYTVTVRNAVGAGPTNGALTVTESRPGGLALVSMAGTGWTCPQGGISCTRSDTLAAGASYQPITVTVNVAANATSPQVNSVSVTGGGSAGANATDSTDITVLTVTSDSVTPGTGSGLAQTFALQYSDTAGATGLGSVWVWFTAAFGGSSANSCMLYYSRPTNTLFFLNNGGNLWTGATLGSAGTLSNSQCTVNAGGATASTSGNTLTLNLPMTFTAAYGGTKSIYMYAADAGGANSGWQARGSWSVPVLASESATPGTGSGMAQTFALQYSDTAGATGMSSVWVWFTAAFGGSSANSCMLYYNRPANALYFLNDAGTQWTSATLGSAGTLSNSQCAVNAGGATASISGNNLTLTLPMTFTAAYGGTKSVYMFAADASGANSGWQSRGSWSVPTEVVTSDAVNPNTGSGLAQTFALQYSDSGGAAGLSSAWVWFTAAFGGSSANSCMLYYNRPANALYFLNDAGNQWTSATLSSGGTLSNSQCAVNVGGATAAISGNTLTLNLPMTFTAAFGGTKSVYMFAADASGASSGWQSRGSWGVTGQVVTSDSATPSTGSGLAQTFALRYSDTGGATGLSSAWVWFTAAFGGSSANSCMLYYNRPANTLYFLNDAGNQWTSAAPGSAGTLSNSQCTVNLGGATASISGNALTLNLPMTFKTAYSGTKSVYLYAADANGANSGWQSLGSWAVTGPVVTADSATPNTGSGLAQTFALRYSDTVGATGLSSVWVWFTAAFGSSSANSCMLYYNRPANTLYFLNDAGTQWTSATLGSAGTLSNSQCALNAGGATVSTSGNSLTLNLPMTFKTAYSGTKSIYMYGADASGASSGWQSLGSWAVTGPVVTADSAAPNTGSGLAQTFALQYSDTVGATGLSSVWVWFTAAFGGSSANSCMLYYNRPDNTLHFLNDAGTQWTSATLGSAGTLSNSQCTVNVGAATTTISGNTLTLNLPMTFKTAYSGTKSVYMFGADASGASSGWQSRGSWLVQ
ncbi:MAG: DUF11 domain-containing protein [Acidobacteriia bacterium]|nr:DUF11 domain-containing protein [Terriglobia bacterium]